MYYLERVGGQLSSPGLAELVEGIKEKSGANVLILENHGVLVYDTSIRKPGWLHTSGNVPHDGGMKRRPGMGICRRGFVQLRIPALRKLADDRCGSR